MRFQKVTWGAGMERHPGHRISINTMSGFKSLVSWTASSALAASPEICHPGQTPKILCIPFRITARSAPTMNCCALALNSTCTIRCPEQKRGNSRQRMGHLRTIRATIYDAVTITALCGPPLPQENRKDGNFQLYRWYKNIGEFLYFGMFPSQRNCKPIDLVRYSAGPPNQRFTRWPSLVTLRK